MKTATADGNVRQWLPKPCTLTAGAAAALLLSVIALSKPLFFSLLLLWLRPLVDTAQQMKQAHLAMARWRTDLRAARLLVEQRWVGLGRWQVEPLCAELLLALQLAAMVPSWRWCERGAASGFSAGGDTGQAMLLQLEGQCLAS